MKGMSFALGSIVYVQKKTIKSQGVNRCFSSQNLGLAPIQSASWGKVPMPGKHKCKETLRTAI